MQDEKKQFWRKKEHISKDRFGFMTIRIAFNKVVLYCLDIFARLLLGRLVVDSPKRTIKSIVHYYHRVADSIIEIRPIRPSSVERYNYPESFPMCFRRDHCFPDKSLFVLRRVNLSVHTGVVWTNNGSILQESVAGSFKNLFVKSDIRPYLSLRTKQMRRADTPNMIHLRNVGFYHFIFEELPCLLHAYEHFPDIRIIAPKEAHCRYYADALRLIFGDSYEERVIYSEHNLFLGRLILVQKTGFSGYVHSADIALLKKHLEPQRTSGRRKKVYVSRRLSTKRKMLNESELEKRLTGLEFQIVYLEKMQLSEQIATLQNAEVIVAPHGAGLSHLIWEGVGKRVIEIFPSGLRNDCYAQLCAILGIDYDYVVCGNVGGDEMIDIEELLERVNICINGRVG